MQAEQLIFYRGWRTVVEIENMAKRNKVNIIITGGSGFIGTNVIEWLIKNGYNFINIDINPPKIHHHQKYWKQIDIRDEDSLKKIIADYSPSHILNLAADLGMDHKNLDTLETNILGVKNLIKVAETEKDIKRILFTSSLLVCRNGYIPKNDTDYCPPNYYGQSKVLGEKLVRSSTMPFEWAIIRPTSIWGPWFDYSYRAFFKTIDRNRYMHIGRKEFQKPSSFVGNTVHMLMKILFEENGDIDKRTFYLADYPWYSTKKWANSIQRTIDSKTIKTAPLWFLELAAFFGDLFKKVFKYDPPLTSLRLKNMLTGGKYPIENTKQVCGNLPYDLDEAVFITSKWMFENNLIKHKPRKV